nr:MAG TPA: hypothetical protein [Caudoviricetes sp.]
MFKSFFKYFPWKTILILFFIIYKFQKLYCILFASI